MSESFWLRIALGTIGAYCALAAGGGGTTPLDAPTPPVRSTDSVPVQAWAVSAAPASGAQASASRP